MANKVAIITDSVACLPRELTEKYNIQVVPIELRFGDEVYRDGVDISPAEFYARLRQAEKLPTTAAALPGRFLEAYQKAGRRANSILLISLSSKLSGMFNSAQLAVENVDGALPNISIKLLDSDTAAAAQGLVVLAAARAAAAGEDLNGVIETTKRVKKQVNLFVMLDTLYYLVKGGRIPRAAAWASSLLKLKPILTVNEGVVHPVTNPRTTRGALKCIVEIMGKRVVSGQPLHVAVTHADAADEAVRLRDQITSRFDCDELFTTEFTPVMGAHTGPGVVGVAFYCGE